jgi:serine/threonine protein kinase
MLASPPQRKYRIERYLAEGGMGAIYIGKKIGAGGFEKEVVLKQLLPEFTERPEFRDLFFREAKISASLDHVNIVRTFDLVSSEDSLFIVMELVRGADLRTISWRARLKRKALSPAGVLHVAMEILAGLSYAHGRRAQNGAPLGIIHRDVSPSNILCSGQGEVKLSDFGIAKATTFSSVFYRVRGKVGYMSPEQAQNKTLDARSDLFSLAVCIFETLTGERLYAGDLQTPPEVIYAQEIPRLSAKRPDLPLPLEAVMRKALAREPEQRYQDARAFGEALRDVARQHGMLYSTPQLAAELAELLGADPDNWSQDDSYNESERLPLGKTLVGKEAASIGVVDGPSPGLEIREDTVSLRPPRGSTPPPSAPDLPIVAPVVRTPTPALRSSDLEDAYPPTPAPARPSDSLELADTLDRELQLTPALSTPAPRFRALWIVAALVLIAAAGVAAGLWWARQRELSEEVLSGRDSAIGPGPRPPERR